ncbi:MAG TPA: glutamate formimidoyltransferase [Planctomycetota bacterium]|nr:glutamate formimidoyltransferase [Planctomycetota bacterium]
MLIECVPNFSEGRRREVCDEIVAAVRAVPGARFLDLEMDPDHNRSVVTFVGAPAAVAEAAFAAARVAVAKIDLTRHEGRHPRMGAVDVIPFIPIRDLTMEDAVRVARELGTRIGAELKVPVFLYEAAATRPDRRNLADIRKPQFEGLRDLLGKDPDRVPDFGPNAIHATAGCVAVGARRPLIAYNIDLESTDEKLAKRIAKKIRERDGGLPGIKALGLFIADRACAQVSINVCDFTRTSLEAVYAAVEREAKSAGVVVRSSEIVGLAPQAALPPGSVERVKLAGFRPEQVIENRL